MIHISHIQKHAPGPPRHIAVETPMMFPVPTREAVDTSIACREDTESLSPKVLKEVLLTQKAFESARLLYVR